MNPKIAKKLSEQFAEMGVLMDAISGTFRSAVAGGSDTSGDAEAEPKVRAGTKPAAKPAAKGKAKAEAADDVSEDDVREALQALAEAKGKGALVAALAAVGAGALKEVDESQYAELIEKANEIAESDDEYGEDGEIEGAAPAKGKGKTAAKPAAKPAAKGKAKKVEHDQDSATAKFTELVEADVKAAKALLKELGVKKFSDLEDDSDWEDITGQIEEAMGEDGGSLV